MFLELKHRALMTIVAVITTNLIIDLADPVTYRPYCVGVFHSVFFYHLPNCPVSQNTWVLRTVNSGISPQKSFSDHELRISVNIQPFYHQIIDCNWGSFLGLESTTWFFGDILCLFIVYIPTVTLETLQAIMHQDVYTMC